MSKISLTLAFLKDESPHNGIEDRGAATADHIPDEWKVILVAVFVVLSGHERYSILGDFERCHVLFPEHSRYSRWRKELEPD